MKYRLTGSIAAKVAAFFVIVLSVWTAAACVIGGVMMADAKFYYADSEEQLRRELMSDIAVSAADEILGIYLYNGNPDDMTGSMNIDYAIYDGEGKLLAGREQSGDWVYELYARRYDRDYMGITTYPEGTPEYTVRISVDETLPHMDRFSMLAKVVHFGYTMRYAIIPVGLVSVALTIVCFVFLMCSAGRRVGKEKLVSGFMVRIPFDLLSTGFWIGLVMGLGLCMQMYGVEEMIIAFALYGTLCAVFLPLYFMNFAVRVKQGAWWRNTLIYMLLRLLGRTCRALWWAVKAFFRALPLVWRTMLVAVAFSIAALIAILLPSYHEGTLVLFWFIANLVLLPCTLHIALCLRKLQESSEALAAGDLSYQVDTSRMFWDLKRAGENLNSIAGGMTAAVEERLKSERMKTELITNVSHDIKTPLTSIINYSDLIAREQTENANITEYAQVLHRQSERLKKLIDDLVEASKASTGNLEVLLAPCELGVLLSQAMGEYQQKLEDAGLTPVSNIPEDGVLVMADGRRMWRVLDNLMNNACKYAMPGTRVYLSLEKREGEAVITFRNTSKAALNISPDELMERFVRGDSSRNTDGSGLGLSIAKSLTELQGGTLNLSIDGDLFKVELRFPLL